MTQIEFSEKLYNSKHKYRQKCESITRIYVSDVVNTCNRLNISISHFITTNPDFFYYKTAKEYIIDKHHFKPITFYNERINRMYGKNGLSGPMSREEFARRLGVSNTSVYLWANRKRSTITIDKMLDICNKFGVNIGEFIEDQNALLPINDIQNVPNLPLSEKYIDEIRELRNIIINDKKMISELKAKNSSLELAIKGYQVVESNIEYQEKSPAIRKWVFNKTLLDNLPKILNITRLEIFNSVGVSNPAVSYNDGNILIATLIDICNRYQISSKYFFIKESSQNDIVHQIEFYRSESFKQISFDPKSISEVFGANSIAGVFLKDILKTIGYSYDTIQYWKEKKGSPIRVEDIVYMCNSLSITPSCFIEDTNKTTTIYQTTIAEIFLEENRLLRKKINKLEKKLQKK